MPKGLFTSEEKLEVVRAIKEAELNTSGDIKVHFEKTAKRPDTFGRALQVFADMSMHHTINRNAVLIYLATKDKRFAIVADKGIHDIVPPSFWTHLKKNLEDKFRSDMFAEGLKEAIFLIGQQMKHHFPYFNNDDNELSDEISGDGNW